MAYKLIGNKGIHITIIWRNGRSIQSGLFQHACPPRSNRNGRTRILACRLFDWWRRCRWIWGWSSFHGSRLWFVAVFLLLFSNSFSILMIVWYLFFPCFCFKLFLVMRNCYWKIYALSLNLIVCYIQILEYLRYYLSKITTNPSSIQRSEHWLWSYVFSL